MTYLEIFFERIGAGIILIQYYCQIGDPRKFEVNFRKNFRRSRNKISDSPLSQSGDAFILKISFSKVNIRIILSRRSSYL